MKMWNGRESELPDKELAEISALQLERAKQLLKTIPVLLEIGDSYSAVNRAYYAAFHAIKALEVFDRFDSKKHSGLIAHFRMQYIKTGIFARRYSEILTGLSLYRQDSDYNIFASIDIKTATEQYENALDFVNAVEYYLQTQV